MKKPRRNRKKKSKLQLFPVKVALILILPSIVLYLFFSIWPIVYSIYIAFTDANAINIASQPKIAELEKIKEHIVTYLKSHKQEISVKLKEVEDLLRETLDNLRTFKQFLENATPATLTQQKINEYQKKIGLPLQTALSIVTSNQTFLYLYKDFSDPLSKAYTSINNMWGSISSIMGFKLFLSEEDVKQIKEKALPMISTAENELEKSLTIIARIDKDYNAYINSVVSDLNRKIDQLSLHFIGLGNFEKLFSDARFPYSILKTLLYVITSVPLKVAVGVLLAFLFSSPAIYGRKYMRALLLIPWALPVLLSVTTWRMLFVPGEGPYAQIMSSILGYKFNIYTHEWDAFFVYNIVEMWLAYPFIMTVTMGAITGIPKELIEAAYIDGASVFTRFRKIMLPLTAKPILFATFMTTGASLQAFMVPLLINGGGPAKTIYLPGFPPALGNANEMIVLYGYNRAWLDQEYGLSAAAYLIVVAILLVYALIWFYYFYKKGGK